MKGKGINKCFNQYCNLKTFMGGEVVWDFQISDLVENPDGTDI